MNELNGIWADDSATYLTDLRHPVLREEWTRWQFQRNRRYDSPMSDERERRDFDRAMVAKYAEDCPPPPRTPWQLMAYTILDQKEEREERQRLAAARQPVYERMYVDEDI